MDLNRLRALLAAPLAALFLILVLCIFGVQKPPSVGIRIPMVRFPDQPRNDCSDPNRIVFLRLAQDGTVWLNATAIPTDRLTTTIATVMENRSDRILYVVADPQVSYGQFVGFLDSIAKTKMVLHVALLTDQFRTVLEVNRSRAYCELEWPENEFQPALQMSGLRIGLVGFGRWAKPRAHPSRALCGKGGKPRSPSAKRARLDGESPHRRWLQIITLRERTIKA
jgi:biopolymer transport protein ExbD